ncbi:MAG: ASKHA domain-containing protein [Armatimonadota bacterium]|nr:ASKHA domain-containing protein [Armatimonadota bacterium]
MDEVEAHQVSPERATVTFATGARAEVAKGTTVLRAAQQIGQEIVATCGARGRCRSCRVQITDGPAPPATLADHVQLGDDEIRDGYRLACQAEIWNDLSVAVAPIFEETAFQILADTQTLRSAAGLTLDSGIVKRFACVPPSDGETELDSDVDALLRRGDTDVTDIALEALRRLPALVRPAPDGRTPGGVTLALFDRQLLAVEPGDTRGEAYGMAFDIGTTTVVGYLVDLQGGAVIATASGLNPQAAFGGDLISRIAFAQQSAGNVRHLRARILRLLNQQIEETCDDAGVARDRIYKVVAVGNTVMHHLFLGINPASVGQAPYAPTIRRSLRIAASDAGLRLNPSTPVFLLPIVAGFVGADAVAMILSTRLDQRDEPGIAADIGTNGELVLGDGGRLLACSAPAGPALEGAQLSSGMRATRGAIDQVWLDRAVRYHVIGGGAPAGICGSGILDALAALLDAGIVEPSGRLLPAPAARLPEALGGRVTTDPDGLSAFVLVPSRESATGRDIVLTQGDIRQVQLAKAAIRSGITVLQRLTGTPDERVAELLLAGGFGNYLNIRSAIRVGLIPPLPEGRVRYVGNAAGLGAQMALVSETERRRADGLARQVRHISLAAHPGFQDIFAGAMRFG